MVCDPGDKNATRSNAKEERLNDVRETPLFKGEAAESDDERGYLVDGMLSVLQDRNSERFYRRLAVSVPKDIIFEALSLVKRAMNKPKIRKSRGALFVAIVKRACADRGIPIALGQPQCATRS